MSSKPARSLPPAEALALLPLVEYSPQGIASRVLLKKDGGNVTLFAFDTGQGLSEHTSPYDALVLIVEGRMRVTIGGEPLDLSEGEVVLMPADVPHALDALVRSRMLLVMVR